MASRRAVEDAGSRAQELVTKAIEARDEVRRELIEFENENSEVLATYLELYARQAKYEEDVKKAIAQAAAFMPDTKACEFAPGYKYVRPANKVVDAKTLFSMRPDFIKAFPEKITIKAADLDDLVNIGELDAKVRNAVVSEVLGSPRCYVPPYK